MEYPTDGTLDSIGRNIETSDRKYLSSRERLRQSHSLRHEIFCTYTIMSMVTCEALLRASQILPHKTEDWRFMGFLLGILRKTV